MNLAKLFIVTAGTIIMACSGKDEKGPAGPYATLDKSLLNKTDANIEYLTKGHPADDLFDIEMSKEESNKQTYGILRFRDVNKDRHLTGNEFQGAVFMEKTQKRNIGRNSRWEWSSPWKSTKHFFKKSTHQDRFKEFEIVFEPGIVEDHLKRIKEHDPYDYNDPKEAMKENLESITGREHWLNNGLRGDEFRYLSITEEERRVEKGVRRVQEAFFNAEKKRSFAAKMKSMFLNQREPDITDTTTITLNTKPWEIIP